LGGCTSWNSLSASAASYGSWPLNRVPVTFAFERLPSQRHEPVRQAQLEALATPVLKAAGLLPACSVEEADVLVNLGMHITSSAYPAWQNTFWLAPVGSRWSASPWPVPSWHYTPRIDQYRREAVILIRDQRNKRPTYEARSYSVGNLPGDPELIGAMFSAAMSDFPRVRPEPHDVSVSLP
jgi:hypothetical protein